MIASCTLQGRTIHLLPQNSYVTVALQPDVYSEMPLTPADVFLCHLSPEPSIAYRSAFNGVAQTA
jgi:hypothetical protein